MFYCFGLKQRRSNTKGMGREREREHEKRENRREKIRVREMRGKARILGGLGWSHSLTSSSLSLFLSRLVSSFFSFSATALSYCFSICVGVAESISFSFSFFFNYYLLCLFKIKDYLLIYLQKRLYYRFW